MCDACVRIKIRGKDNYQLDGDVVGESTTLTAEIQPGALAIRVQPRPPASRNSDPAEARAAPGTGRLRRLRLVSKYTDTQENVSRTPS
jgi:hypothetical protein